jgi:hypothetical protein
MLQFKLWPINGTEWQITDVILHYHYMECLERELNLTCRSAPVVSNQYSVWQLADGHSIQYGICSYQITVGHDSR